MCTVISYILTHVNYAIQLKISISFNLHADIKYIKLLVCCLIC